ncbi:hypothetical protein X801_03552, partial [Opisthorchis viverrini]
RWRDLFDPENTGRITLAKFCEVLGLQESNVRDQFDTEELKAVETIVTDMSRRLQVQIVRVIHDAYMKYHEDEKEMVKYVKQELDRKLGRLWH